MAALFGIVHAVAAWVLLLHVGAGGRVVDLSVRAAQLRWGAESLTFLPQVGAPLLPALFSVLGATGAVVAVAGAAGAATAALPGLLKHTPAVARVRGGWWLPLASGPVVALAAVQAPDLLAAGALLVLAVASLTQFVTRRSVRGILTAGAAGALLVLTVAGALTAVLVLLILGAVMVGWGLPGRDAVVTATVALLVTPALFTAAFFGYLTWWFGLDGHWLVALFAPSWPAPTGAVTRLGVVLVTVWSVVAAATVAASAAPGRRRPLAVWCLVAGVATLWLTCLEPSVGAATAGTLMVVAASMRGRSASARPMVAVAVVSCALVWTVSVLAVLTAAGVTP